MTVKAFTITGTTPAAASTAVVGDPVAGLGDLADVQVTATFGGATGGALDIYLQRFDEGLNLWVDWIHFPQKAAAAASNTQTITASQPVNDIFVVGHTTTPALAADTFTGGHPGQMVRCLAVAGASTTVGAAISIGITGRSRR